MSRLPKRAEISIGIVLLLFAVMGVTNSEHALAKVVYAALIAAALATIAHGIRRPRTTDTDSAPSP